MLLLAFRTGSPSFIKQKFGESEKLPSLTETDWVGFCEKPNITHCGLEIIAVNR